MKKIFTAASLLLFSLIQGCSKNDDDMNKITVQAHDENLMMGIMHNMMDDMMAMKMTMDPDEDFAMMMKMHHQGAIEMANAELKDGKDAQMKTLAQQIITAQEAEITQLDAFVASHAAHKMDMEFHEMMMAEMEKSGKHADLQIINGNIDHDFAILMVEHHHSAIESARMELIHGHDAAMQDMAKKIINAQIAEIETLQNWLLANTNK